LTLTRFGLAFLANLHRCLKGLFALLIQVWRGYGMGTMIKWKDKTYSRAFSFGVASGLASIVVRACSIACQSEPPNADSAAPTVMEPISVTLNFVMMNACDG
jgi:hypothetical protein